MKELEEKIGKAENMLYQSSNVSSSSGTSNKEYIYINDSVLEPYTEDEEVIKKTIPTTKKTTKRETK